MSTENPLTPDIIREQAINAMALPKGLSRSERRALERQQRKEQKGRGGQMQKMIAGISEVRPLGTVDELLESDDLSICREELKEYELFQANARLGLEIYRLCRVVGVPDQQIRAYYAKSNEFELEGGEGFSLFSQVNPVKMVSRRRELLNLQNRQIVLMKQSKGRAIIDEDARQLMRELITREDILTEDILKEIIRSRAESIELIKLQIEWLIPAPPVEVKEEVIIDEPQIVEPEKAEPEADQQKTFSLTGWNLFWTKNRWSQDPNHLVPIPTSTREEALESFSNVARGEISVKRISVLNALEFHLQKNVIQKALATRNKYGPEGIKDWVKIKRGGDRIFLAVSEAENRAVFFAAGRDDVYKNI